MIRFLLLSASYLLTVQGLHRYWPPIHEYSIKRDYFNQRSDPQLSFSVYLSGQGKQYRVHIDAVQGWATKVNVTTEKTKEIVAKMLIPSGIERTSTAFKAEFEIRNEMNRNWASGLVKQHDLDGEETKGHYLVEWAKRTIYAHGVQTTITFGDDTSGLLALVTAVRISVLWRDTISLQTHSDDYPDLVYLLTWAAIANHSVKP